MCACKHYKAYRSRALPREARDRITILFGGATWKHERLIAAALGNLGYRVELLPNPVKRDFDAGKELIDPGACAPTYFTVGNLINVLREKIAAEGRDNVAEHYVFFTAGACGACRFGQYHESYELALANIDLPDLRICRFDQAKISTEATAGQGIDIDVEFTLAVLWAVQCGDLLCDLEYMARPYELEPGATDRVLAETVARLEQAFLKRPRKSTRVKTILWFLTTGYFTRALRKVAARWSEIRLDRLRVKPKVKITGEFWMQVHEGDGNYGIKRWLEQEGAEVVPVPIAVWVDYLLHERKVRLEERKNFSPNFGRRQASLWLMRTLYRRAYEGLRRALRELPHPLPVQEEIARLAAPFYNFRLNGGESHMLIGKALLAYHDRLAHMICEVVPFGCLPATMSVGAMANVLGRYPDLLHASIEVKGDAEIHALSRCQMTLTEAKRRARREFEHALADTGLSVDRIRAWEADHPEVLRLRIRIPQCGAVSTAANYVRYVAKAMQREWPLSEERRLNVLPVEEGAP